MNETPQKLIEEARQAFLTGSRELMADMAVKRAFFELREQWQGELEVTDDMNKMITLHSHLRVLRAVQKRLESMVSDNRVAKGR
jgi:hypothetical protein